MFPKPWKSKTLQTYTSITLCPFCYCEFYYCARNGYLFGSHVEEFENYCAGIEEIIILAAIFFSETCEVYGVWWCWLDRLFVCRVDSPTLIPITDETSSISPSEQSAPKNGPRKSVSIVLPEEDKGWPL